MSAKDRQSRARVLSAAESSTCAATVPAVCPNLESFEAEPETHSLSDAAGREVPSAESSASGRDARGRAKKGNLLAMRHGGRSVQVRLALMDERRAALSETRTAIINDMGGAENVGTLKANLIARYLETNLIAEWLGGNLMVDGVLTTKGRTRAAATLYLQVLDRLHRLTTALGLERRSKQVPTLAEYLAERSAPVPGEALDAFENAGKGEPALIDDRTPEAVSAAAGDEL
jgi:hypothetical protein